MDCNEIIDKFTDIVHAAAMCLAKGLRVTVRGPIVVPNQLSLRQFYLQVDDSLHGGMIVNHTSSPIVFDLGYEWDEKKIAEYVSIRVKEFKDHLRKFGSKDLILRLQETENARPAS